MEDFLNLLLPLVVVVLMIVAAYFTTKYIAKKQNTFTSGRLIQVIERVSISRDTYLAIVKVGDKLLLLSTSSGKTELITELDSSLTDQLDKTIKHPDFFEIFSSLIKPKHKAQDGLDEKNQ